MKRPRADAIPPDSPPADASLPATERAELQRQGAKAAARGDDPTSNPMNAESNAPAATGESAAVWRQRQAAWQGGHEAQSKAEPPAPPASAVTGADHGHE